MSSHTRLFVGNIPESTNENKLHEVFSAFGVISNLDLKIKDGDANQKKFAFITLYGSSIDVESCIRHFSSKDVNGSRLHVTRARESFLERLQREREQSQSKANEQITQNDRIPLNNPVINLSESLNPRKRKTDHKVLINGTYKCNNVNYEEPEYKNKVKTSLSLPLVDQKKVDSDNKRLESIKRKRQEFKEKQLIIKTSLVGIDKVPNKKVTFSDSDQESSVIHHETISNKNKFKTNIKPLFEDDNDSDNDLNFEVKEQFEGRKGQKVLELQSRYKSDKRFILDERFVEDDHEDAENIEASKGGQYEEQVDVGQSDEKIKQLNILQDVLGVSIKSAAIGPDVPKENRKTKMKMGMLRFDPTQPDHARFMTPIESIKPEVLTKTKKKKYKEKEVSEEQPKEPEPPKVEVSKDQFYKVSDSFKEAITQPKTFSLRSLFAKDDDKDEPHEEDVSYIPIEKKKEPKFKNPLEISDKNPFKYDSSDSECETEKAEAIQEEKDTKAVWREKLFFSKFDYRFKEGLAFFNKPNESGVIKDRRELKSLMKKRLYNKERKDQMFQKKIGGRKKIMKKTYNKKKSI